MTTRPIAGILVSACLLILPATFAAEPTITEKTNAEQSAPSALKDKALKDEPDAPAQLNHEALTACKEKKYEVAQHLFEKVLLELEKEKDSELSVSEVLENIGLVLQHQQKTKEAEQVFARSTAIRKKFHLSAAKPKLVEILPNENYRLAGMKMIKETSDIIDGHDPMFPPDQIGHTTIEAYTELMNTAYKERGTGQLRSALVTLRKAVAIAHHLPKPEDQLMVSLNQLAGVYRHLGRPVTAQTLYQECMTLCEKVGKGNSEYYATLLDNAAQVKVMLHEDAEAQRMMETAIEIYKKTLPADSPDLAMTMCNLGEIYLQEKENKKGIELIEQSYAMLKKTLKPEDSRLLITQDNLAEVYAKQGDYKKAEELQKSLIATMEKEFGDKPHHDLAIALNNLAQTLYREKKYDEAAPLLKRSIDMHKQIYGPKHPKTLHQIGIYASFMEKTGHKEDADKIMKELAP